MQKEHISATREAIMRKVDTSTNEDRVIKCGKERHTGSKIGSQKIRIASAGGQK